MYYWAIPHFYGETKSLKKFISQNKLLFASIIISLLSLHSSVLCALQKEHESAS